MIFPAGIIFLYFPIYIKISDKILGKIQTPVHSKTDQIELTKFVVKWHFKSLLNV